MNRSHALSNAPRRSLIALLCVAAAGGVFAQEDASRTRIQTTETPLPVERGPGLPGADTGVPPKPIGPVKPVKLGCCRCLGETLGPINISTGQPVPWTVNSNPTVLQPVVAGWHGSNNLPPLPLGTKWIGPVGGNMATAGTYTYQLKIEASQCAIRGTMTISGQFWADNKGTVSLTGTNAPTNTPSTLNGIYGFTTPNGQNFSYTVPNAAGSYTLTVTTFNEGGPTGMVMNANVIKRCVTEGAGPVGDFDPPPTK